MEFVQPLIMLISIGLFSLFIYAYTQSRIRRHSIPPCETIYKIIENDIEYTKAFPHIKDIPEENISDYSNKNYRKSYEDIFENIKETL